MWVFEGSKMSLPSRRLGERSARIGQRRRELCRLENTGTNLLDEIDVRQQRAAWIWVRIQYTHLLVKLLPHDLDWLQKVRIVRNDYSYIEPSHMGVMQQMSGQVNIRSFFFCLDNLHIFLRLSRGHSERHHDFVGQEVAKMNGDFGDCSQRPQIELLPYRLVKVIGACRYQSREILDFPDGVFRQ